jgi:hypothetical protein
MCSVKVNTTATQANKNFRALKLEFQALILNYLKTVVFMDSKRTTWREAMLSRRLPSWALCLKKTPLV